MSGENTDVSADLLRRWQANGDRAALEELLEIEIGILKSRLRRQSGAADPAASVSDLAQDAVMRMLAVDPPPRFDDPRAMRGYLWTAAWRLLVAQLRKNGTVGNSASLDDTSSGRLESALATSGGMRRIEERDRSIVIDVAVSLLDPEEQEILRLCYFRDLGIEGAAKELRITHGAAKMRLVRARKRLTEKLAKWSEFIG
jgi:RNA polymerase sigma factor (sigma-70 family)